MCRDGPGNGAGKRRKWLIHKLLKSGGLVVWLTVLVALTGRDPMRPRGATLAAATSLTNWKMTIVRQD